MKVIISGYGKMGHMIEASLLRKGITPVLCTEDVCGVDPNIAKDCVCIDFTTPEAFRANYCTIAKLYKAVVVGTTGWGDIKKDVIECFEKEGTPMIYATNFSIGVNALFAAVQKVSSILAGHEYTPEIEETHHIHKMDAPSGTAISLGDIVKDNLGEKAEITSIREGEVPGTHVVRFKSSVDKLVLSHEAYSREGFAEGAVYAATLTCGLKGVHEFKDLILK